MKWHGAYKIPWEDPDFSKRMLAEHLAQDHDMAIQTFYVTEANGGQTQKFHSTTKAWPDRNLIGLLTNAGFHEAARRDEWPCNTDDLKLWVTRRR